MAEIVSEAASFERNAETPEIAIHRVNANSIYGPEAPDEGHLIVNAKNSHHRPDIE